MKNTILTTLDHIHCHIMHLFNYIYKNMNNTFVSVFVNINVNQHL